MFHSQQFDMRQRETHTDRHAFFTLIWIMMGSGGPGQRQIVSDMDLQTGQQTFFCSVLESPAAAL